MSNKKNKKRKDFDEENLQSSPKLPRGTEPGSGFTLTRWQGLPLLVALIAVIAFVVYKDFIFFNKFFLFKDIGSDSININYPQYAHIAQYLRTEGIPKWSFNQGMGQNIFPGCLSDPFTALLIFTGKNNIAYGMAYAEILKIFLAGIFFYLFLKKVSISEFAAVVGALFYAFSGFMVLGGGWGIFSTEAVYAALLLYSFERLYQDNKWALFPVSVALIAVLQPFDLYLYGLFLCVYLIFRYLKDDEWELKKFSRLFLKVFGLGLLGAAASSFFLVNNLLQMFNSPRVAGEASLFAGLLSKPVFGLGDLVHYGTAILRFFSNDILGTGSSFLGWGNYLEAPLFYCGLLTLLTFTQIFSFLDKRKKILYSALLCVFIIPVIFPYFRYAYWLFAGDYYRNFSLFVSIVLLLFGVKALDNIDKTSRPGFFTLALTLAGLLTLLYYPYASNVKIINDPVQSTVTWFLIAYAGLTLFLRVKKIKPAIRAFILLTVAVEATYMSYATVNNRPVVTGAENREKTGYYDYSNEAVAYLKARDKSFFRIEKDYFSGAAKNTSVNDAKVQDFYGTPSYHSFNQINYIRFLQELELIQGGKEVLTRWAPGLRGCPPLHSFASVKYALSKSEKPFLLHFNYAPLAVFGDVKVLENKYALPLGFTYDKHISLAEFRKIPGKAKVPVLYKAFVIDETIYKEAAGYPQYQARDAVENSSRAEYARNITSLGRETLVISEHGQNIIRGRIALAAKKLLFFSIPFDPGWAAKVDGKSVKLAMVNIGFTGLFLEKGGHDIELSYTPPYYRLSAVISLAAILIYCCLLLLPGAKSAKKSGEVKRKLNTTPSTTGPVENSRLRFVIPVLVALLTFIVFLPALNNGFVDWDDIANIVDNWKYRGLGWTQFKWMFTTFHLGPYQPLSWLTYSLDYLVWDMNPFGYHLTNVILHSLNAFVFCLLFPKLLIAGAGPESRHDMNKVYFSAGVAALFFAIHPLRVESVAWVTERRDVLSGLFYLLTILFYIQPRTDGVEHAPFWRRHMLPLFVFFLALLSKGMVISLPVIFVILDTYPLRRLPLNPRRWFDREFRAVWLEKIPYFALAAIFGAVGYIGQNMVGAIASYAKSGLGSRAAQVFFSGGFYIWKTLVPLNLVPIYQAPAGFGITSWQPLLGAVLLLSTTAAVFALRRLWPVLIAAWLFYLITIAPVSGIVKLSAQIAADRYTYLSCLGFAVLAGAGFWAGMRASQKLIRNAVLLATCLVIAGLGCLSWRQTKIWRDSETLWRHTLAINNELHFAHNNLAMSLVAQGKPARAIVHYREALRINPGYAEAYNNMGIALFALGKSETAVKYFNEALRIAPGYAEAYYNIGVALFALGKSEGAGNFFNEALFIKPNYANAHHKLGLMLASQGELDEAVRHYREALRINPGLVTLHYNLGVGLAAQGKLEEAAKHYREEFRINPGCAEAHLNLSVILFNQGKLDEAIKHCQEALRVNPDYAAARNNLAVMLKINHQP